MLKKVELPSDWKKLNIGGSLLPGTSMQYKTGSWKSMMPILNIKKCIHCMKCWVYCPENTIKQEKNKIKRIDFSYCKGCGLCAKVCPVKCITMKKVENQ